MALSGSGLSAGGREHAAQAFAALGARVTDPIRDAKFDSARTRIATAALLPSRIWDDTSVWTSGGAARRTLLASGRFHAGHYRLDAARAVPAPQQPADSRHVITLARLSENEFAWDTEVAYALGGIGARGVAAFVRALIAGAEGTNDRGLRADYRAAIPVASSVLGQLFRVDSIRTAHLADSSTLATFVVTITPEGVARYPDFSRYVQKYVETARMRWTLTDRAGAPFLDCSMRDGRIHFRVRSQRGVMVPLAGPARPLPDSLTLHGDMTMKVRIFTAGFRNYRSDFVLTNTSRETGFAIASTIEPEWVLPLAAERLLRTPLRRPFQGKGAQFSMSVRDSAGAQTILWRRLHLEVKESAILRFIGRLTAVAVNDFTGRAERQQSAWLREVFAALAADIRMVGH